MNHIFQDFCQSYAGRRVAFLGVGVSHIGIIPAFIEAGAQVTVCDRAAQLLPKAAAALNGLPIEYRMGDGYLDRLTDFDLIFRSPGITPLEPGIRAAEQAGVRLTGEIELFFDLCPCRSIGITGSDGKTTTSTLISEMLRQAGRTVHLGGNIGDPLLPRLSEMTASDIVVAELSSFQLMTFKTSPTVAVITNIHRNHLDYHRDMAEYIAAKKRILDCGATVCVLNADDPTVMEMGSAFAGEKRLFCMTHTVENGAFLRDGALWLADGGRTEKIIDTANIKLPGFHNIMNAATAIAAVRGLAAPDDMRRVLAGFGGVKHRIQLVRELDGVRYYNDSIGTTPSRTVMCLRAFPAKKQIVIAGGSDKGMDFTELSADMCRSVRVLILIGATAGKIEAAVRGYEGYNGSPVILHAGSLEEAVLLAREQARPGESVALSPASASFDQFRNYGERGDRFAALVNAL